MKIFAKVGGIVKNTVSKMKSLTTAFSVLALGLFGVAAHAAGETASYSPVERAADGTLTFTPQNVMGPVMDGAISSYTAWAGLVVLAIVIMIMFAIFKKK